MSCVELGTLSTVTDFSVASLSILTHRSKRCTGVPQGALLRTLAFRMAASLPALLLAFAGCSSAAAADFDDGAPRYWPKFGGSRAVSLLDGEWDYDFIDGWDSGFDSMSPTFKPADAKLTKKTAVPSCSDVVAGGAAGYLGPRGVAMYQTTFDTLNARSGGALPVRLQFQSCSFYCRVFVNGEVRDGTR